MRKFYLLFLSVSLVIGSCRLDPPIYPDDLLSKPKTETAQPVTKESVWSYQADYGSHVSDITLKATGTKKTIATLNYDVFTGSMLSGPGAETYFLVNKGMYSFRQRLDGYDDFIEFFYLKDDASPGQTWTKPINETGLLDGATARSVGKLVEKSITFKILDKVYTDVYHTRVTLDYKLDDEYVTFATYDFYIAKGVGIIQINTNVFGYESYISLKNYTIK